MKKILFVLAAVVTMSFASCGNKTTTCGTANDSTATDTTVVDSTATDSTVADSTVCPM